MAPDKIFLAFEHGFVAQTSTSKKDANGNSIFLSEYNPVEYIRKDALLEWVKERKNINLEEADEKNDMFFYGVATGFAAMIDKLNSM